MKTTRGMRSVLSDQKVVPRHSWWRQVQAGEPALADVVVGLCVIGAMFGFAWLAFFL